MLNGCHTARVAPGVAREVRSKYGCARPNTGGQLVLARRTGVPEADLHDFVFCFGFGQNQNQNKTFFGFAMVF